MLDVQVKQHGGLYLFACLTDRAKQWIKEHTDAEGWQWLGNQLCLDDRRLAVNLAQGMLDAGLEVK